MISHAQGNIRYYTFASLAGKPVRHAIFTRQGGVSEKPWDTLNLGGTVGDDPQHVQKNRHRVFEALGLNINSLYDVWQVHSADIVCTDQPRPERTTHLKADAILTDRPGVTLFMRFADCVPLLLFEPKRGVIGLVHAGWKGTVSRIAERAVLTMHQQYGSSPKDILAMIGPSIGPDHYEVGQEVIYQVQSTFGPHAERLLTKYNGERSGRLHLDLWAANQQVLLDAGVRQIEMSGICTACQLDDWYSHRAESGRTGRFGALVSLD
jgi:hypothetical protein